MFDGPRWGDDPPDRDDDLLDRDGCERDPDATMGVSTLAAARVLPTKSYVVTGGLFCRNRPDDRGS